MALKVTISKRKGCNKSMKGRQEICGKDPIGSIGGRCCPQKGPREEMQCVEDGDVKSI
jgi:hypothetical protein